ncbi:MAG TPA: hypothetical protein VKB57_15780 [Acidimicrobiales bacterium]|nr:hypothetical protein [Acidimicrobiales bacterium]
MTETPTEPAPTEPAPPDPEPTPPDSDDELSGLDDRARRLVDRANTEAARFRHEARRAEEQLQALQREHETEQERLVREAEDRGRQEGQAEVERITADFQRQLATMAIKAKAADRFNDAADAVLHLPLDELLAIDNEATRDQAVDKALADLLEAKPYLGRGERRPLVTQGGRSEQPNGRPRERSWLRG